MGEEQACRPCRPAAAGCHLPSTALHLCDGRISLLECRHLGTLRLRHNRDLALTQRLRKLLCDQAPAQNGGVLACTRARMGLSRQRARPCRTSRIGAAAVCSRGGSSAAWLTNVVHVPAASWGWFELASWMVGKGTANSSLIKATSLLKFRPKWKSGWMMTGWAAATWMHAYAQDIKAVGEGGGCWVFTPPPVNDFLAVLVHWAKDLCWSGSSPAGCWFRYLTKLPSAILESDADLQATGHTATQLSQRGRDGGSMRTWAESEAAVGLIVSEIPAHRHDWRQQLRNHALIVFVKKAAAGSAGFLPSWPPPEQRSLAAWPCMNDALSEAPRLQHLTSGRPSAPRLAQSVWPCTASIRQAVDEAVEPTAAARVWGQCSPTEMAAVRPWLPKRNHVSVAPCTPPRFGASTPLC